MAVEMREVFHENFSQTTLSEDLWRTKARDGEDIVTIINDDSGKRCLDVATDPGRHGSTAGAILNTPAYNSCYRLEFEFKWVGSIKDDRNLQAVFEPKEMKDLVVIREAGTGRFLVQHWLLRPDRPQDGIFYRIWEKALWSISCDIKKGLVAHVLGQGEWSYPCEAGQWYRMEVVNTPENVKFRVYTADGELLDESPVTPHCSDLVHGHIWFAAHAEPFDKHAVRYANIKLSIEDNVWLNLSQTHLLVERDGKLMQVLEACVNSPGHINNARLVVNARGEKVIEPEVFSEDKQGWISQQGVEICPGWSRYRILVPWPGYDNELSVEGKLVSGSQELATFTLKERCFARKCTIYVRPTMHCDIGWDHYIEEGIKYYGHDQIERIIENLEKYPALKFTMEIVWWVQKALEEEPALKSRLEPLIKSGRFCVSLAYVSEEPDRYDEEALVRNLVIGKKWMMEEFGVEPSVYVRLDPPGQIAAYPQLMKLAGAKIASERRTPFVLSDPSPLQSTKYFDYLYYRQGIDGTRCLYYWDDAVPAEHLFGIPDPLSPEQTKETLTKRNQILYNCVKETSDTVFVGTQGHECQLMRTDIGEVAEWYNSIYSYPKLEFVTLEDVLNIPELHPKNIRTIRRYQPDFFCDNGDIAHGPTTDSYTQATRNLVGWEIIASVNELLGLGIHNRGKLNDNWARFAITMAHGPGAFNQDMADQVDFWRLKERNEITDIAKTEKEKSLAILADHIAVRRDIGKPLIVFNPLAWKRTGSVELPLDKSWDSDYATVQDEQGHKMPCQVVKGDDGARIVFTARNVPALGYRTYYLNSTERSSSCESMSATTNLLETPFYRLELSSEGEIKRIYDRLREREIADTPGVKDENDPDRFCFNQLRLIPDFKHGDDFSPLAFPGEKMKLDSVELEEFGPVRVSLLVKGTIEGNPCKQRIRLYAEDPRLEFTNWIDFREGQRDRAFKVLFPFNFVNRMTAYAISLKNRQQFTYWHPFAPAVINEFEEAGRDSIEEWNCRIHAGQMDIAQPEFGYSIATNPFSWVAVRDGVVCQAVFSSFFYCGIYHDHINQFIQERNYVILPHDGYWQEIGAWRLRHENNMPLMAAWVAGKEGSLPETNSLLEVVGDSILVNSIKVAEDEKNTIVLRLVEQVGQNVPTKLRFNRDVISAHETDIIERPGKKLTFSGNTVKLEVKPYKIVFVKVKLTP